MAKSFTGAEFIKALAEGSLKEAIVKDGMVNVDKGDANAIQFSEGTSCALWTKIPVEMIEQVDFIRNVRCKDHQHPYVRIQLKEPIGNPEAAVFHALLKNTTAIRSKAGDSAAFSLEDENAWLSLVRLLISRSQSPKQMGSPRTHDHDPIERPGHPVKVYNGKWRCYAEMACNAGIGHYTAKECATPDVAAQQALLGAARDAYCGFGETPRNVYCSQPEPDFDIVLE